jgi:hypothetical protein
MAAGLPLEFPILSQLPDHELPGQCVVALVTLGFERKDLVAASRVGTSSTGNTSTSLMTLTITSVMWSNCRRLKWCVPCRSFWS